MSIVLPIIIMLVLGSAYAVLLKRKLAETFFLAIVSIIAILYLSGLLNYRGSLLFGIYSIILITVISTIYLVYCISKDKKVFHNIEFTQGMLLVIIVLLFSFYTGYKHVWTDGDEFSYWGIAVKHMYLFDAFTTTFSDVGSITLPMYFPGSSLLHYFFTRFSKEFLEYPSYVSMNILYFSTVLPLTRNILTKDGFIKGILLVLAFVMIPLQSVFFPPYATLTVDYLLANVFGMAIVYYFFYGYEDSAFGIMMVSASIVLLTILKDAGLFFALVICGIVVLDTILFKRHLFRGDNSKKNSLILFSILPLLLALFVFISWKEHLKINLIFPYYASVGQNDIINFFKGNIDNAQKAALDYCINAIIKPTLLLRYSVLSFLFFFFSASVFFAFFRKDYIKPRRIISCVIVILTGAFIYGLGTIFTFVFSFYRTYGTIEVHLESFSRYIGSYVLGMQIFMLVFFAPREFEEHSHLLQNMKDITYNQNKTLLSIRLIKIKCKSMQRFIYRLLSVCMLLFLVVTTAPKIYKEVIMVRRTHSYAYNFRPVSAIQRWLPYIRKEVNTPIYIISQHAEGWWRTRMLDVGELYPYAKTRTGDSTIAVDVPEDLPSWPPPPQKFSPEEWEQYVISNNITYLYVDLADDLFIKSYGQFFKNGVENGMLYHINVDNHGKMYILPVELMDNLAR